MNEITRRQRAKRDLAYRRLYAARVVLGDTVRGLHGCRNWHQYDQTFVEAVQNKNKLAHYQHLQTCKSLWLCPLCSQAISATRRETLNRIVSEERRIGNSVALLTYTVSHRNTDSFATIRNQIVSAHAKMRSGKQWASLKDQTGYVGGVTSTEITNGSNGWHIHKHELISISEHLTKSNVDGHFQKWRDEYLYQVERAGGSAIDSIGFDAVVAYGAIGSYVQKSGIVPELLSTGTKSARGDNLLPFQILDRCFRSNFNMPVLQNAFREYAKESHGMRQCVPSVNWRSRMLREAKPAKGNYDRVIRIDDQEWRKICSFNAHSEVLEEIELGD